jgi:aspartate/methionine/tyrosine aminotransferase
MAAARVAPLPLDAASGFQPDFDAARFDDAALLVLNYPSNPCAACERPGTFEAAVAAAHERGCWVLNDLAYGFLAFDGHRARSVLEVEGAREVALELWSPSKIYGMAGWRIGFAVGAAELVGRIQLLLDHLAAGVWTGLQRGLIAALRSDQSDVAERRAVYERRRDVLAGALRDAGADVTPSEGSFYLWWRLPDGLDPQRLIEEARVGVAPGEGFGARGAGWARLSLAVTDETLEAGLERLREALRAPASQPARGT